MVRALKTVWLHAYSPDAGRPIQAYHTVFTGGGRNGRAMHATVSLSHLTTLGGMGAGAWIRSVAGPFGPPANFHDFAVNSHYHGQTVSVTYGLSARAAEAYAQGNMFLT
jgi:hypothetical protein